MVFPSVTLAFAFTVENPRPFFRDMLASIVDGTSPQIRWAKRVDICPNASFSTFYDPPDQGIQRPLKEELIEAQSQYLVPAIRALVGIEEAR